jgi:uncharacterized membrane protein required for colicin V production
MVSPKYFFGMLTELVGDGMGEAIHLLATLCAVCIISALFNALSSHFSGGWADKVLGFCSSCAIFAAIIVFLFMYDRSRGVRSQGLNTFAVSSLYLSGLYCFLIIFAVYGSEIVYNNYPLFAKMGELIQFWR